MVYQLTAYAAAQLLTGIISLIVAHEMWKRRDVRGGWPLFLLFVMVAEWALANGMEAAAVPQALKIFWSKVAYLGAQTSPVLLVIFSLTYSGRGKRLTPLNVALMLLVPVATIFLAGTNDIHGLIWTGFLPGPAGSNSLIYQHGPAFWVSIAYVFMMVSIGTAILAITSVQSQKIFRTQGRFVLAASLIPWIGSLAYLLNLNPFPGLDLISISFLFTGLVLVWGMFRGQLFRIIPIAHELVAGSLKEGLLVIDENFQIVDANPAALRLIDRQAEAVIGKPAETLGALWSTIQASANPLEVARTEVPLENEQCLEARVSPLKDQHERFIGWAVVLDDVSERRKADDALRKANERLTQQLAEIQELQERLQEQAVRDSMTGVYNRRYLEVTLKREVAHANRKDYPLSIIMLDVDHFKNVNDKYGHQVGDDVLASIGKMLMAQTRESDCVSRFGGDEFVLVMPEMDAPNAYRRAELWRQAIQGMVFQVGEAVVCVTVSLGIATTTDRRTNSEALLKAADDALYRAKQDGRNRTCAAKLA